MPQEFKLILKHLDQPGYTPDIECYLRHGGYDALKKALAIQPKDLPDGKKASPQEQIRDDVKLSGCDHVSLHTATQQIRRSQFADGFDMAFHAGFP